MFRNLNHTITSRYLLGILFVGLSITLSGCSSNSTDTVINELIKGGEADKEAVIKESEGLYKDYQVYRDPVNTNTIVLESTYADGAAPTTTVDQTMLTKDRIDIVKANQGLVKVLQMGINITVRDKTSDGNIYFEYTVTQNDLQ